MLVARGLEATATETGEAVAIPTAATLRLSAEGGSVDVTVSNAPPVPSGLSIFSFTDADSPAALTPYQDGDAGQLASASGPAAVTPTMATRWRGCRFTTRW